MANHPNGYGDTNAVGQVARLRKGVFLHPQRRGKRLRRDETSGNTQRTLRSPLDHIVSEIIGFCPKSRRRNMARVTWWNGERGVGEDRKSNGADCPLVSVVVGCVIDSGESAFGSHPVHRYPV